MSSFSSTPGRETRVRFDTTDYVSVGSPWGQQFSADKMCQGPKSRAVECKLIDKKGYILAPIQDGIEAVHELQNSQPFIKKAQADGGTLQVPDGIVSKYTWRKPTELGGVLTGAASGSSGLADQGDYFLYKKVSSTTDWSTISLPGPFSPPNITVDNADSTYRQNNLVLVNVATDSELQDGSKPFMFRFATTGAKTDSPDVLFVVYFCGPAGLDEIWTGLGQYCMVFKGDGTFQLFEYGKSNISDGFYQWNSCFAEPGRYANKGQIANTHHRIIVFPFNPHEVWQEDKKNRNPRGLTFIVTAGDKANNSSSPAVNYYKGATDHENITYVVPYKPGKSNKDYPPTVSAPLRVQQRVDLRSAFQLSSISYKSTGRIITDPITIPGLMRTTDPITVEWRGTLPPNTTLDLKLFDASIYAHGDPVKQGNTGIAQLSSGSSPDGGGGFAYFAPYVSGGVSSTSYQIRADLTGSDTDTPGLKELKIYCSGVYGTSPATEFTIGYPAVIDEVNISGPESDPSHETAKVSIRDLGSNYTLLNTRGQFSCRVDTKWQPEPGAGTIDWTDPSNDNRRSVLFDGYAIQSSAHREGSQMTKGIGNSTIASFPASDWRSYNGTLVGKWKRLEDFLSPFNWDFSVDPNASNPDTPPYVVDVIKAVIEWAGFPDSMIDIGDNTTSSSTDYPIRLFPRGEGESGTVITAGAKVSDFIRSLARDYLGAALVWDANATAGEWDNDYDSVHGCWRLIHPTGLQYQDGTILGNFNILCNFFTYATGANKSMVHNIDAYPVGTGPNSQVIRGCPILKDTLDTFVTPPEITKVVVTGTGQVNNGPGNVLDQLTVFAVNTDSYKLLGDGTVDTTLPDFLGYERVGFYCDPIGITTPEAAKWICRRLFSLAAHARKHVSFTAPLVLVTDVNDTAQKRPRPLRFYDAVTVDGQLFLVRNCNPFYNSDEHQLAFYELESIPPEFIVPYV